MVTRNQASCIKIKKIREKERSRFNRGLPNADNSIWLPDMIIILFTQNHHGGLTQVNIHTEIHKCEFIKCEHPLWYDVYDMVIKL